MVNNNFNYIIFFVFNYTMKMDDSKKIFRFKSGLKITFQEYYMIVNTSNYNSSINYINVVNYSYSNVYLPRFSQIGLATRILIFGWIASILILFPVKDEWGALFFTASSTDIFLAWLSIIIGVCAFLIAGFIFLGFVFSAFMEISFLNRFIERYFSDQQILAVIGNKSGNNIQFHALNEEISKVKSVNEEISCRKKLAIENVKLDTKNGDLENDFHSNLKKLNELLIDNIITQKEFDLKKKQILGL
jgi:hypothetical protein